MISIVPMPGPLAAILVILCAVLFGTTLYWRTTSSYWETMYNDRWKSLLSNESEIRKLKEQKKKLISVLENALEDMS
jgi:hypothetical protein